MTERTILGPEVLVTRATLETAVERLALQCARGARQLEAVREWLETGTLPVYMARVPTTDRGVIDVATHGTTARVGGRSWLNLRTRLTKAGFAIKAAPDYMSHTLYWRK